MVENLKFLLSPFDTMADETEDPATELGEGTLNTNFPFHILEGNTKINSFLIIELNRVRGKTTKLLNNLGEKKREFYYLYFFCDILCRWFRFAQLAKGKKFRP